MKFYSISITVAMTVGFLLSMLTSQAQADTGFSISMNGTSVFQNDGFESDTIGELPIATTVGAWYATELGDDVRVRVMSELPGAVSGSNFLDMYDPRTGVAGHPYAEAVMTELAEPGDSVTVKFGLYLDSADNTSTGALFSNFMTVAGTTDAYGFGANFLKIGFQNGDFVGESITTTGIGENDLILGWYDGTQYHNVTSAGANMYMSPDEWHLIQMDADLANGWTITVDGVTSDLAGWRDGHQGGDFIDSFMIGGASADPTHFYIDGAFVVPSGLPGDANNDYIVNDADAAILAENWQKTGGSHWGHGDFNGDGNVDDIDATILATNWQAATSMASVPEAGSLLLIISGLLSCLLSRRRR